MLETLVIQNFAIIDQLTVDFSNQMTILTGETGAGKSIIIDALSLLAGSRGSSEYIRHGEQKATLQAIYTITTNEVVKTFLRDNDYPVEDQLVLSRELHVSGKNVIRINGVLSTVLQLKTLGQQLIDIHSQHEHQLLMDSQHHLQLLDLYGGTDIDTIKQSYEHTYDTYITHKKTLKALLESEKNDASLLETIKLELSRIEAIDPQPKEDELLLAQLKEMQQQKELYDVLHYMTQQFFDDDTIISDKLDRSITLLQSLQMNTNKTAVHNTVEQSALADTNDVSQLLEKLFDASDAFKVIARLVEKNSDQIDYNDAHFSFVQERLLQLESLKETYDTTIDGVLHHYKQLTEKYDQLSNQTRYIEEAQEAFLAARKVLEEQGNALSDCRQRVCKALETDIHQQLRDLHMANVVFHVQFNVPSKVVYKKSGKDDVVFYVATNIGEPLKPLAKVASGGELSRLMLALKTIFLKTQSVNTIVFDEIDTGVSGRVAQAIAQKMLIISQNTQVLAITHLPQVAAMAHQHAYVQKYVQNERTQTQLVYLQEEDRQAEIAKMFAGDIINDSALQHAKTLLDDSTRFKASLLQ